MKLGEIIKTYRFEHKLSLREFAHQCGVSFAQVRLMERGTSIMINKGEIKKALPEGRVLETGRREPVTKLF